MHSGLRQRDLAPLCAIQPMYSVLKRQAEVEILPMTQALGLAVVTYGPTAGGSLTGKYAGGARPERARLISDTLYQTRYADSSYWAVADAFAALAAELGHRPATLAVGWVASHPAVTSVLLGARSLDQLNDTLAAADLVIDDAARARVAALTPAPPPATDRSEERTAPGEDWREAITRDGETDGLGAGHPRGLRLPACPGRGRRDRPPPLRRHLSRR